MEYIPDPIELMEARCDRIEDKYIRGDDFICCRCRELKPLEEALPATPSPDSPPICHECVANEVSREHSDQ